MNTIKLLEKIKKDYFHGNYQDVVDKIDLYLSDANNGVFALLLDMKMNALIYLSRLSEASSLLDLITKYFPDYNSKRYIASKYILCGEIEKAEYYLLADDYDADIAYNLGKIYLKEGNFELAKKHLKYAIENHNQEIYQIKAKKLYIKINNFFRYQAFVPKNYKYYKHLGGKVFCGDVIYTNKLLLDFNQEKIEEDNYALRKPYLIWKIKENKILCLPLTLSCNDYFCLPGSNYPNIGKNRYVLPYMVLTLEENICDIVDHIHEEDMKKLAMIISDNSIDMNQFFSNDTKKLIKIQSNNFREK